jgi:hypothetical protein
MDIYIQAAINNGTDFLEKRRKKRPACAGLLQKSKIDYSI